MEPGSPALQTDSVHSDPSGKPFLILVGLALFRPLLSYASYVLYLQKSAHSLTLSASKYSCMTALVVCELFVVFQSLIHVPLSVTPWTAEYQASLSFTISKSLLKLMSTELVMPSNHLILCHPLHLLLSIFPSIRVFSSELTLPIL